MSQSIEEMRADLARKRSEWRWLRTDRLARKEGLLARGLDKHEARRDAEYRRLEKAQARLSVAIRHLEKKINRALAREKNKTTRDPG